MLTDRELELIGELQKTIPEVTITARFGYSPAEWIAEKKTDLILQQMFDHPAQQKLSSELRKNPPKDSPPQKPLTSREAWDGYGTAPDRIPAVRAAERALGINSNPSQSSMTPAQWRRWNKEAPAPAPQFKAAPEFLNAPLTDPVLIAEAQEFVDLYKREKSGNNLIHCLDAVRDSLRPYVHKLW